MTRYRDLTSRRAVLAAIAECDRVGIEAFRKRYGFERSSAYPLQYEGRLYDSKAIVGVAYGFQYPDAGPLAAASFSGGKSHAARHLSRLGFDVEGMERSSGDWSLKEVEEVVAIYFEMVAAKQDGSYRRIEALRRAKERIPARDLSAIERKVSNICAILKALGLPYLKGFGALGNKQTLLAAVLFDWLLVNPDVFDSEGAHAPAQADGPVEVPPPRGKVLGQVRKERRGCRVDFADRDARNRRLGRAGEAWALAFLKEELRAQGRPDLADEVVWVSDAIGDGLGYDIASFTAEGLPLQVEVKATNGSEAAPFIVTSNEVRASLELDGYVLMRIFSFSEGPRFYRLHGSLEQSCQLAPRTYASLPRCDDIADDEGGAKSELGKA